MAIYFQNSSYSWKAPTNAGTQRMNQSGGSYGTENTSSYGTQTSYGPQQSSYPGSAYGTTKTVEGCTLTLQSDGKVEVDGDGTIGGIFDKSEARAAYNEAKNDYNTYKGYLDNANNMYKRLESDTNGFTTLPPAKWGINSIIQLNQYKAEQERTIASHEASVKEAQIEMNVYRAVANMCQC